MRYLLPFLLLPLTLELSAQRQWGVNDSTTYAIGGDTVLIASRKALHRALPGDTVLLRDFSVAEDEDLYIRDVDHWSASDWYVLVGSRYIGSQTTLWRTTDAGVTWSIDESFLPATEIVSVNQMAITPDGTAYLFNGYYQSEILRSSDRGVTWSRWLHSLIAHYYGIIPCGNTAFIYGMVGDGFRPALWQVPDTLWALTDIQFWSGCHNSGAPGCHNPPFPIQDYPDVVSYFEEFAAGLCLALPVEEGRDDFAAISLVLDPEGAAFRLTGLAAGDHVAVFDASGRSVQVGRSGDRFTLPGLAMGIYSVAVRTGDEIRHVRFFKP
ncbi:MAG: hypothetical protein KF797_08805 [Flavobacteriales bacterium]|nr:hypothetical protein [Flavobacteriales bacterium]